MNEGESRARQHFPFLERLENLPAWDAAATCWLAAGGVVVVLGGPDAGKSTLCRYLVYRAYAAGKRTALIDLDLGQSHLGPPTCLGLGFFPPRRPGDGGLFPEGLHFIGRTSPVGAVLEVAVGCRLLCDQARSAGFNRVVVNTSGFIQGPGAFQLKRSQVELLDPALILALQHAEELEPLLRRLGAGGPLKMAPDSRTSDSNPPPPLAGGGWGEGERESNRTTADFTPTPTLPHAGEGGKEGANRSESKSQSGPPEDKVPDRSASHPALSDLPSSGWPVLRLPVSSRVVRRAAEERRRYREERFRGYFRCARRLALPWRTLVWEGLPLGRGRPLPFQELERISRSLELEVLYAEDQDSRLQLLLPQPPASREGAAPEENFAGKTVHWLAWSDLHFRLVGLLDGRRGTLALGLLLPAPWDPEILALWTPLDTAAASGVRFLKMGRIKVNLEGQEL